MSAYRTGWIRLLKVDVEGGEFAVFGVGEDLRCLDQVDQVVMELHPAVSATRTPWWVRLRQHGYAADPHDNAGTRVRTTSSRPDYAYFWRS